MPNMQKDKQLSSNNKRIQKENWIINYKKGSKKITFLATKFQNF